MTQPITITQDNKLLAHHTSEHSNSSYGQLVWSIADRNPRIGPIDWEQNDSHQSLYALGVLGGWLVARQTDGLLVGIIWSDGDYFANFIDNKRTGEPATNLSLYDLESGDYQIRDTLAIDIDGNSCLGMVLAM